MDTEEFAGTRNTPLSSLMGPAKGSSDPLDDGLFLRFEHFRDIGRDPRR